jgi:hypothetical protein
MIGCLYSALACLTIYVGVIVPFILALSLVTFSQYSRSLVSIMASSLQHTTMDNTVGAVFVGIAVSSL